MGNSCGTAGSVEVKTPKGKISQDGGDGNNNNNNTSEICEPCTQGSEKCSDYVRKALDAQRVTTEGVTDYSDSLLQLPAENELTFNFDGVEINEAEIEDVPDDPKTAAGDAVDGTHEPVAVSVSDVGTSVPHAESEEEIDISSRVTKWSHKRRRDFDYKLPSERYTSAIEDHLDVRGTTKRKIIAISDLHLGGPWSHGMDWKLEQYLKRLLETAEDEVACLVLLGDIFEMWLEKFAEVPPTNEERVASWKEEAAILVSAVNRLVNDCGVKVFFVRGNHDHEITKEDVAAVFDSAVIFVPCTLILRVKTGDEVEQRIRFAHGHEWDVFNSYILHHTNNLLPDRPIGYYIARAVSTSGGEGNQSEIEDLLIGLAQGLLSMIPASLEDDLVDSLIEPAQHRRLISRLFEGAFKVKDIDFLVHAKCKVDDDKWIRLDTMLNYPLMRLCSSVVGKQDVFHMIKASTGDYKKFIKRADEDVLVLAHTHRWDLRKYKNNRGNQVVYANTGCWTNNTEEFSSVVLTPPSDSEDGTVLIDYGKNKEQAI